MGIPLPVGRIVETCLQALARVVGDGGRLASLKVAIGTLLLSLLVTFPHYRSMRDTLNDPSDDLGIQALLIKTQNPLSPIPAGLKDIGLHGDRAGHVDKLELRLTIPILGWLSRTGAWTVAIWHPLSALGVFYLLARLASKAIHDNVGGALFVLGLGPTFFGSWFFVDYHFGDGIAFFFLLLSIASGSLLLSACSFIAAAFCDERCLAVLPLLCFYYFVSLRQETERASRLERCAALLIGAGVWVLLRSGVAAAFHLTMGTSLLATRDILRHNLINGPGVLFGIFKASWTLPLFGLLNLLSLRKWAISAAFAGVFALAVAPAFLVIDFNRSVCYTFMILLVSIHFLWGDRGELRQYLAAIVFANLLLTWPGNSILGALYRLLAGRGML